jgi:hypothetical protein
MNTTDIPRCLRGVVRNPHKAYQRVLQETGKRVNFGTNVYDHDWDVLILLDACRYDLFQEFAPGHDIYDRFGSVGLLLCK